MRSAETWENSWQARVRSLVRNIGYEDVYEFVMSQPSKNFGELFEHLRQAEPGKNIPIAYVQLPELFYIDAKRKGCLEEAVVETLVRSLRQYLRHGWNSGKRVRERRIDARVKWPIPMEDYESWQSFQSRFWTELESLPPPDKWCPQTREDPLIKGIVSVLRKNSSRGGTGREGAIE